MALLNPGNHTRTRKHVLGGALCANGEPMHPLEEQDGFGLGSATTAHTLILAVEFGSMWLARILRWSYSSLATRTQALGPVNSANWERTAMAM
jgi:hypothetical protein